MRVNSENEEEQRRGGEKRKKGAANKPNTGFSERWAGQEKRRTGGRKIRMVGRGNKRGV